MGNAGFPFFDSQRLILVDHREAEHLLVKGDRSLHVGDLNADMVNVRALEIDFFLSGSRGSAGGKQREAPHQVSPLCTLPWRISTSSPAGIASSWQRPRAQVRSRGQLGIVGYWAKRRCGARRRWLSSVMRTKRYRYWRKRCPW